jgi:hypothetical protein
MYIRIFVRSQVVRALQTGIGHPSKGGVFATGHLDIGIRKMPASTCNTLSRNVPLYSVPYITSSKPAMSLSASQQEALQQLLAVTASTSDSERERDERILRDVNWDVQVRFLPSFLPHSLLCNKLILVTARSRDTLRY